MNYTIHGITLTPIYAHAQAEDVKLLSKVTAIPIGIDFHSKGEKVGRDKAVDPCIQQDEVSH